MSNEKLKALKQSKAAYLQHMPTKPGEIVPLITKSKQINRQKWRFFLAQIKFFLI